jgi:hypothetical protein
VLEAIQAVRLEAGADFPLLVKWNSSDLVENGLGLEDSIRAASLVEEAGADALEISGGLLNRPDLLMERPDRNNGETFFETAARLFQEKISIPLILVGGIRSYKTARRLVEEGTVDFIALCRPFIREPGLANRWASGDQRDAACISCNQCVEELKQGNGLQCRPAEPREVQTFFPQETETIPAGQPFPAGTAYRVSYGLEDWQGNYLPVVKVQLVQGEKILGEGLSLPGTSEGWREVAQSIEKIITS